MTYLVRPGQQGNGCTGKPAPVTESSNSASGLVRQELDVVQDTTTIGKAGEIIGPSRLVLVAVAELDVGVV